MSFASLCLLTVLLYVPSAQAGGSLRGQPLAKMTQTDVETLLMSEFSNAFRGGAAREHISRLELELRGMYMAVPKDASGRLGHALVCHMLHRFFMQKHGWFIRGLQPGNASGLQYLGRGNQTEVQIKSFIDDADETAFGQEWVPGYLQEFIEEIQGGRGINLRELAVLAAALEHLIHNESNQRVEMSFAALELPFTTLLDEDQIRQALEVYMMVHIWGGQFLKTVSIDLIEGPDKLNPLREWFATSRQDWEQLQEWTHSIQMEVAPTSIGKPLDFTGFARVAEEVGRRYATYNDLECDALRSDILQIESTKAGRVRLADFYKKGLYGGTFAFTDKIEYLRALGAIDDSNTSEPYVIIPNYVASRTNCLDVSDFYVICCRNECDRLLATIENKLPMGNPRRILELVASLSTKTVEGPRTLPATLVRRLNFIADTNEGLVPFHGRLFAQWMHHAFPRECPYPQLSVDVATMAPDEWLHATGHESVEQTNEEMQVIVDSDSSILPVGENAREQHDLAENDLPWDEVEEVFFPAAGEVVTLQQSIPKAPQRSLLVKVAPVFFILGAAAFAWKMKWNTKSSGWRDGLLSEKRISQPRWTLMV